MSEHRRRELADFLRTRREKLKPEQVGITHLSRRRTPGLRREEVAELAGVGTTWYTWLEQARDIQPSSEVLRRLANALRMNTAETRHLFALAGKAYSPEVDQPPEVPSESILRLVKNGIKETAVLVDSRWDVLAINDVCAKNSPELAELAKIRGNFLIHSLKKTRLHATNWEHICRQMIGQFRAGLGDTVDHPWVTDLLERLSRECPEFDGWWKAHDVHDISPVILEVDSTVYGKGRWERSMISPSENPRLKILIFSPLD